MIKKILVVSDSHGKTQNIKLSIDRENPDMLIHLGDLEDDPEKIRRWLGSIPAVFVQGNCDRYGEAYGQKQVAVFELNSHRFFCTHGHRQAVNYGLQNLMYTALENGCDIAMYGHTHIPYDEICEAGRRMDTSENSEDSAGSVRILNPGSISLPRGGSRKSYIVINFEDNNNYSVELKYL